MDAEDLKQTASERMVDLTKAISGLEGKRMQSIAFKIYNARKEVWDKVRQKKIESNRKPIHEELQKNLEEFLEKRKEEKKIDIEQIQKFRVNHTITRRPPPVDLYKISDQMEIEQSCLGQGMETLKSIFNVQESDSD